MQILLLISNKKKHEATIEFFLLLLLSYLHVYIAFSNNKLRMRYAVRSVSCVAACACVFNECLFIYFLFHLNIFNSNVKEDKWQRFTCAYGVN